VAACRREKRKEDEKSQRQQTRERKERDPRAKYQPWRKGKTGMEAAEVWREGGQKEGKEREPSSKGGCPV
jgi:hypothetical protein